MGLEVTLMPSPWRPPLVVLAVLAVAALAVPRHLIAGGETAAQADDERPVILAVGESTTAGYGVDRDFSYPAQLQQRLDERGYHYRVVNHGVSGSTTAAALTRLDRGLLLKPRIVIVALGGNDASSRTPIDITRANLAKLISMFKRTGAEVFVANRSLPGGGQDSGSVFAALAKQYQAVLMPPLLSGVSGHPDLLIEDGSHPNAEGYTIIVRNLLEVIEPYLKKDAGQVAGR
jgi:acyl-CoA thioesterase-1